MISFFVPGFPITKGHLIARHTFNPKGNCKVWVTEAGGNELMWWRSRISEAGRAAMEGARPLDGKVYLACTFYFPPNYKIFGGQGHDVDTLTRAVMDSLTVARVYRDDSQVAELAVKKMYMDAEHPAGAAILLDVQP